MKDLKGISISARAITALYERANGERVAEEHVRIGAAPSRRGTWRREGETYLVVYGNEPPRELNVMTPDCVVERFKASLPNPRRGAEFRARLEGGIAGGTQ